MRMTFPLAIVALLVLAALPGPASAADVGQRKDFKGPVGLQLYSLRDMLKQKGVAAVLDQTCQWGFKYVEVAGLGGLTPAEFKAELDKRGLVPIGKHFPYNDYRDHVDRIIAEAKALGIPYAGCAWINHKAPFDEKQCRETAAVFNRAGKALAEQGITFYLHNHGFEFVPYKDGTLFDLLVAETDPRYVQFQLDVMWAVHPGQDPVKLLEKHPNRWVMLHLKDLRKGVPTGLDAPRVVLTDDVALGTGQVAWAPLLRTAQKIGVKYYFIEDESPTVVKQVPKSLRFLEQLKF